MRLNILTSKDKGIRSNCGVYVLEELIRKSGLKAFLKASFPQRAPQARYCDADLLLGLTYANLCGADYLEDINEVKLELECEYLRIPSSDTIEYRMKQLSVADIEIKNQNSQVNHRFNINTDLNRTLINLGARLNPEWRDTLVDICYDNTIITTGRDSEFTYKKVYGYQPGVGTINNQVVYVEGRNGNSNSPYKMEDTLERMFDLLEQADVSVGTLRIDAAAFSQHIFRWLEQRPQVKYYISSRDQGIDILQDAKWETFQWGELTVQATSIPYSAPRLENHNCRLVVYRQKRTDRQSDLFHGEYVYRYILTNDWKKTAQQVAEFYNMRAASERVFEYLKYDFNWLNMPFAQMSFNTTYLLFTAMSHLIYKWLLRRINSFKGIDPTIRPKKFNLYFIKLAGKWIQTGRKKYLKLFTDRSYQSLLSSA